MPQAACASPLQTQAFMEQTKIVFWVRPSQRLAHKSHPGALSLGNVSVVFKHICLQWDRGHWLIQIAKLVLCFSALTVCCNLSSLSNRLVAQDRQFYAWCSVQQTVSRTRVSQLWCPNTSVPLPAVSLPRLCSSSHVSCGLSAIVQTMPPFGGLIKLSWEQLSMRTGRWV